MARWAVSHKSGTRVVDGYIESIILPAESIKKKMPVYLKSVLAVFSRRGSIESPGAYLRLDENKVDKKHHKVMLDILVGEALASRTLGQSNTFGFVRAVQLIDLKATFYAYWHRFDRVTSQCRSLGWDGIVKLSPAASVGFRIQ